MSYYLRKLKEEDIKEVALIMKNAFLKEPWKESWDEKVCEKRISIFNSFPTSLSYVLINDEDKICAAAIGYTIPFLNDNLYELQDFFIDLNESKKHLGSLLMNVLIKVLKEEGVSKIKFYTSGELYKFYSKFGYSKVNEEYLMELKIKD